MTTQTDASGTGIQLITLHSLCVLCGQSSYLLLKLAGVPECRVYHTQLYSKFLFVTRELFSANFYLQVLAIHMRYSGMCFHLILNVLLCMCFVLLMQAKQLHDLWVSPGAVAKENRRRYAQIRRGDSRKGLERIGRCVMWQCISLLSCTGCDWCAAIRCDSNGNVVFCDSLLFYGV